MKRGPGGEGGGPEYVLGWEEDGQKYDASRVKTGA